MQISNQIETLYGKLEYILYIKVKYPGASKGNFKSAT